MGERADRQIDMNMQKVLDQINVKLRGLDRLEACSSEFGRLRTNEERIVYVMRLLSEHDIRPMSNIGCAKSASESVKLREKGNKAFLTKKLDGAKWLEVLKLYTASISYAPCPSEDLALAFANRSAVLYHLRRYADCVTDIDRALAMGYPEMLRAKIYIRKVGCLAALKSADVEDTVQDIEEWMGKLSMNETNRKKFQEQLRDARATGHRNEKLAYVKYEQPPPPTLSAVNPEIPCASDSIAVEYNPRLGRHVVATRDIRPGEVLAIEKPYSVFLPSKNVYTHCFNCLEACLNCVPCDNCVHALYCSEECKTTAWKKYHEAECAVLPPLIKLEFSKLDLFGLRMTIQTIRESSGLQEVREVLKELDAWKDARTKGFSKNGKLEGRHYKSIYSLVTNQEKRSSQDLFRRALDATFITYYLATQTSIFGRPLEKDLSVLMKDEDVVFVGTLVLLHQQIVPSNMHSFTEERGVDCVERGLVALPFCSLINHSCDPNILRHSRSSELVIYSLYPIKKGEQVLDNYGQFYAMVPRVLRRKELLKQYYFVCDCVPCRENWPLYYDLQSYRETSGNNKSAAKVKQVLRKFNTIVDQATVGNIQDKQSILEELQRMILVLHKFATMPCVEMCNVVETLKRVYGLNGNRFEVPIV